MARKLKGKEITSSHRKLRIEVTDKDIEGGTPLDPENCAMAQAIRRALGKNASVHRGVTLIEEGKVWRRYRTTSALRDETMIFDRGGRFMPGEYDLKPMPVQDTAEVKRKYKPKSKPVQRTGRPPVRRVIPGVRRTAQAKGEE